MAAPLLVARYVGYRTSALNALACAVLTWSLAQPHTAASVGFMLSVLATGAILVAAPPLANAIQDASRGHVGKALALAIAVPCVAQAACTPVLITLSPEVSLWSVAANIVAELIVAPATLVGFLALLVAAIWPPAAEPLVWVSGTGAHLVSYLARWSEQLPGAHIAVPTGLDGLFLVCAVLAVVALYLWLRHEKVVLWAVTLCVVLVMGAWTLRGPLGSSPQGWQVAMCDVGQGDALLVRAHDSPESPVVLVDTGPDEAALRACLDALDVRRISLAVLTHPHADHTGGVGALVGTRAPTEAWVCPLDTSTSTQLPRTRVTSPLRGASARVGTVHIDVLWPADAGTTSRKSRGGSGGEESEINDCSLVVSLSLPSAQVKAPTTIMALGDLEPPGQQALVKLGVPEAQIVKVAHHGSRRQHGPLYAQASPNVALIGVGENTYGHPHPDALTMLEMHGARVFRTDQCGLVTLTISPQGTIGARSRCAR